MKMIRSNKWISDDSYESTSVLFVTQVHRNKGIECTYLFGMFRIPLFVNHKGKDVTLIGLLINEMSEVFWGMRKFTTEG